MVRGSLTEWAKYRGFEPAAHHQLIIGEIEAFLENDDEVLLLFAPPGCAKSTFVSVLLPSYYLSRFPKRAILAATHSGDFALRWGRRVRNDIILEAEVLGIQLASDSQAADRWALATGGEYYGVGAGVGIAGYRADLGIIDDLFGTREDAFSAHIRQKRWDWYVDDFSPRLKPKAKRIVMATRWHLSDVSGRILEQMAKGIVRGRVVSIAAKAKDNDVLGRKPGEYLWDDPDGYNYGSFLRQRERETDPMMWSALYQQEPVPETGDYWKAEWLRPYTKDQMPARSTMTVYGASDWAVTSGGGDYTTHLVFGIDPDDRPWLLDGWRGQASSDVWVDIWCDLVKKWKPLGWAEEKGQIGSSVGPFRDKRARERQAYVACTLFPTRGDKAIRAQSMRGRIAQLGLHVPVDADWYADFRSELMSFPAGAHDDYHDALGLVGQLLDEMATGSKPKKVEVVKSSGYAPARSSDAVDNWKVM
jgi:predicted phage terminase large subunit-like protein